MRAQYSTNIRIIRVPCTGKVDVIHILKAFESGVDGVYVVGCEEGNCNFQTGNLRARRRVERVKRILEDIGIESGRVEMKNLGAGDGPKFVAYAKEMVDKIREIGPSPIRPKEVKANKANLDEMSI